MTDGAAQSGPATQRGSAPLLLAVAASVVLHGVLVAAIARLPSAPQPHVTPVAIEIVETPRPAPPAATPPPASPAPPRVAEPRRMLPPRVTRAPAPPQAAPRPEAAPPPPNAPSLEDRKPSIRFGVSMSSTTAAGTYAAPVGNSVSGEPPPRASEPSESRPYRADRYAPSTEVSTLPVPVRVDVPKSEYPPDARREGFEGAVRLRLLVAEDGTVRDATVVSDPGHGLGTAAARAARRWFRFRPALKDGVAVATEIPFTVEFQLQ